ncbi:MAG: hypothetical protein H8E60_10005 [Candidatus Marinimicrobia bacterium]|nr:hypothetical protein [Candidatus Neomarinimicrobiota bacterium]
MILRVIPFFFLFIWTQEAVGSWYSYSSFHTIYECKSSIDNNLICLTDGGLLNINLESNISDHVSVNDGLSKSKYSNIEVDKYDNVWISSNYNTKNIDIWSNNNSKFIDRFEYNVNEISKMESDSLNLFAIYSDENIIGLMHFIMQDSEWKYQDYYNQFGHDINEINDIKILDESIFITTNVGLIKGNLSINLKNSSSWELISESISMEFVKSEILNSFSQNTIFQFDENYIESQINFGINGIIDVLFFLDKYYILTKNNFYSIDLENYLFEFPNPFTSEFNDLNIIGDKLIISVKNHGFLIFNDLELENPNFLPLPSSLIDSEFSAITTLENNNIIGIGVNGLSLFDNYEWYNFIPQSSGLEFDSQYFNNKILNYKLASGGDGSIFPSWSIIESNSNKILFGNTQIQPNSPGYAGALIEYNIENEELIVFDTTNQVLDGLDGIFNSSWNGKNLIVNQIKKDPQGNIWVLNPYAEGDSNIIAIRPRGSDSWVHIQAPNGQSFLPTELDFDKQGRVWVSFDDITSMEGLPYSEGGIKVILLVGDLNSDFNYYWREINNPDIIPDKSVWSIAIDKQDFIWVLTSSGIQGYSTQLNSLSLSPIYLIDFYNYIPFFRGDHIRVDSQDNKWITTRHSGVKVILENTQYWPSAEGFTYENSGLLSNVVNDLSFDEENGYIWFATELGLSRFDYPINYKNLKETNLLFHPNPYIPNNGDDLIIEGCFPNGTVQIVDINGNFINSIKTHYLGEASTQTLWDGTNKYGEIVNSGVYLISSTSENGEVKRGKLAIIRQ